jgi:saccharopine dehydrogenase-like NADP-dependent oxidoreductase
MKDVVVIGAGKIGSVIARIQISPSAAQNRHVFVLHA